jgi:DNA-binding LytR/AlgR family response regulator
MSKPVTHPNPSRIAVRYRNHEGDIIKYLEVARISFIAAFGSSVRFHLTDGHTILSGKNLAQYQDILVHRFDFVKVGRSYIVNPREIDRFNNSDNSLILKAPDRLPPSSVYRLRVSREVKAELLERFRDL